MLYYMYILNSNTSDCIKVLNKSPASALLVYSGESYFYLSLLISASVFNNSWKSWTDLFDDADCGEKERDQDCDPAVEGCKDLVQDMICPGGVRGCY